MLTIQEPAIQNVAISADEALQGLNKLKKFVCSIRNNDITRTHSTVVLTGAAQSALGSVLMQKFRDTGIVTQVDNECRLDLNALILALKMHERVSGTKLSRSF